MCSPSEAPCTGVHRGQGERSEEAPETRDEREHNRAAAGSGTEEAVRLARLRQEQVHCIRLACTSSALQL